MFPIMYSDLSPVAAVTDPPDAVADPDISRFDSPLRGQLLRDSKRQGYSAAIHGRASPGFAKRIPGWSASPTRLVRHCSIPKGSNPIAPIHPAERKGSASEACNLAAPVAFGDSGLLRGYPDTVKSPYLTLEPDFYCRLPDLNLQLWRITCTSRSSEVQGGDYCTPYMYIDPTSIAEISELFNEIGIDPDETDALVEHICDYVMNDHDVKHLALPTWDLQPAASTKHLSWMHLCWGDYAFNLHADVFYGEGGHLEVPVNVCPTPTPAPTPAPTPRPTPAPTPARSRGVFQ